MTACLFLLGRFIKGLPVNNAVLPEELKKTIGLETMPNGISYVLSTKVHRNTNEKQSICSFFFLLLLQNLDLNGFSLLCAFISNSISYFKGCCVTISSDFQNYIWLHIDRKGICLKGGCADLCLPKDKPCKSLQNIVNKNTKS